MHRLGDEVDLVAVDRPFLEKHCQQKVTIGFANAMRVHISQQNVARHRGQLQIFIFSQESVRVRDSIFADLRRSNT